MKSGDIYWADIAFVNRLGSKIRPVLIIDGEVVPTVLVLASTSKYQPNLNLLHAVDFDAPNYRRVQANGLHGMSYFYRENLKELDPRCLQRFVGEIRIQDLDAILNALDGDC